jgi:hypothetical protein
MSRARWRKGARLPALPMLALAFACGCAALLGMESATCSDCASDTSLGELAPAEAAEGPAAEESRGAGGGEQPDAGAAPAAPPDACESYCQLMASTCDDSTLVTDRPYMNRAACLALCRHIPPGNAGDTSGNTLTCRAALLQSAEAESEPALVCEAAGRGGQAGCGMWASLPSVPLTSAASVTAGTPWALKTACSRPEPGAQRFRILRPAAAQRRRAPPPSRSRG